MKKTIVLLMAVTLLFGTAFALNRSQTKTSVSESLESEVQAVVKITTHDTESEISTYFTEPSIYEMYHKAFTYIMDLDSALNADMKYIAIEYKSDISNEDKQNIAKVLVSYGVEVFEANLEDLSEVEYSDGNGNLFGILITIDDVYVSENIIISFTKYRSGMGSISTQVKMIQNENGEWEIEETDAPVISS